MKIENIELQKFYVYTVIGMEVQIKKFNWILFVG